MEGRTFFYPTLSAYLFTLSPPLSKFELIVYTLLFYLSSLLSRQYISFLLFVKSRACCPNVGARLAAPKIGQGKPCPYEYYSLNQ